MYLWAGLQDGWTNHMIKQLNNRIAYFQIDETLPANWVYSYSQTASIYLYGERPVGKLRPTADQSEKVFLHNSRYQLVHILEEFYVSYCA